MTPKSTAASQFFKSAFRSAKALFLCLGLCSSAQAEKFTFISYNLKNWLGMARWVDGERVYGDKPEDEKAAVVSVLSEVQPDVLGLCEIGSVQDLADLQKRLKRAGIDLPHSHYTHGYDETRRQALLSRFPIVATNSSTDASFDHMGKKWTISRGILDTTVDTPLGEIRFVGLHLKSKRPIDFGDEAIIRREEAQLARNHVNRILKKDPSAKVCLFGDFNDTRQSPALKSLIGRRNSKTGFEIVDAEDVHGTRWTYHWSREDIYSRIDWVLLSQALKPFVSEKDSFIVSSDAVKTASDHRPIVVPFRAQ